MPARRVADPGYKGRHDRVVRARGRAGDYLCVDRGAAARDWSHTHGTDGLDVYEDYEPRCRSCHMKYDEPHKGNRFAAGHQNTLGYKHTPEAREKIGAYWRGRKRSPETIEKMKAAQRRRALEASGG